MEQLLHLVRSLDRCPHGRHEGETCAGHRGPGMFDGGCLGGVSLGNPYLKTPPPGRIGSDLGGFPITFNDLVHAAGIDHVTEYGIEKADGTRLVMTNEDGANPVAATLEQARDAARLDADPYAHVIEIRHCHWVSATLTNRVPEQE